MSTRTKHVPPIGASAGPGATLCETGRLPVDRLTKHLSLEAHRPKEIYQSHKWFARRIGASFRSLLIGSEVADERSFWQMFHGGCTAQPMTVLDPFVGGGTSVVEAAILGHKAIGLDIDPVACAITSFESRLPKLPDLRPHLDALKNRVGSRLRPFYLSKNPEGDDDVLLHAFWVQHVTCINCGVASNAHPNHRIAFDRARKLQWLITPSGQVLERPLGIQSAIDPASGDRFSIEAGTAVGGVFTCPACATAVRLIDLHKHVSKPPTWALFAVEILDPTCTTSCVPMRQRIIRAATPFDIRAFHAAEIALAERTSKRGNIRHVPLCPIPRENRCDDRLLKYGYTHYHQLFNPRQLLHLSILAEEILRLPEPVREAFSIAYSDHLTTNCMQTAYASGWRRLLPLFTFRAFTHSVRPVEINPWLERTGRGTYPNAVCSIQRASRSFKALTAPASHPNCLPAKPSISIHHGNASKLGFIRSHTVDLVLTDPPYFDNIAYSELSHFYLPWLRMLGVVHSTSDSFLLKTLATHSRTEHSQRRFQVELARCFVETHRVLKPGGRLVFTFQHKSPRAWAALATALTKARFEVIDVFPLLGDGLMSPHKHQGSSSWDAVFVARPTTRCPAAADAALSQDAVASAANHTRHWSELLSRQGFNRADVDNLQKASLVAAATQPPNGTNRTIPFLDALESLARTPTHGNNSKHKKTQNACHT